MKTDTPRNTAERLFPLSLDLAEEWKVRAEKAEAEVERLREKLKHAVYLLNSYNPSYSDLFEKEFK